MTACKITALTARTAVVLFTPLGARFTLPKPVDWTLKSAGAGVVDQGRTKVVAVFLDGLEPSKAYTISSDLGELTFFTPACGGFVDVCEVGVSTESENNAAALQVAIARVPEHGTVYVPPGRYLTGPISLKPHMTLHLAEGAELAAISDREDWPILPAQDHSGRTIGTWEGLPEACYGALVTAIDCDGLKITGQGIIDGGGDRGDWWQWPKETRNGARRPRTVHLAYCDQASLSGVTIRNSPSWTLHPYRCTDLTATAIKIENPPDSPNTDGLNPESCLRTTLSGIHFSVGDDCIAIKAGKRGPTQTAHLSPTCGVEVDHCRMERGHGAVVLGSEMSGDILDVTIRNCEFIGTDRGLRLKTRRGRGGRICGVHLDNVLMQGVATPIAVNAFYFCDPDGMDEWVQTRVPRAVDDTTPEISDITITNVKAYDVATAALALLGLPERPIQGLSIERFMVAFDPASKPEIPLMANDVEPVLHQKVIADFATYSGEVTVIDTATATEEVSRAC